MLCASSIEAFLASFSAGVNKKHSPRDWPTSSGSRFFFLGIAGRWTGGLGRLATGDKATALSTKHIRQVTIVATNGRSTWRC